MPKIKKRNKRGSVIVTLLIIMPFLLLIVAQYTQQGTSGLFVAKKDQYRSHAQLATDAGVDYALQAINLDDTWTGTSGEIELHNADGILTKYSVSVTDTSATSKLVESTGSSYRSTYPTTPLSSVTINVSLRAVKTGEYSIVSGVGGLTMSNSAKIVNGSVYINGKLTMSNSSQIGLSILPVDVKVAHQSCPSPANATYPRVCASGENGQPISLSHTSHIYGRVEATNQTDGSGMSNTGLVASSSAPPVSLPDYDRNAQKAAVTNTMTGASASCSAGLKTWPANTKITGDVTISNLCVVTVEGDIWITGKLLTGNLGQMVVKTGLTSPPVIMIDGVGGLQMRNSSAMLPNLGLVGFRVITYWSTASCSPDCPDITGTDLFNSQSVVTIDIDNSASGAQTEFYARWSKLTAGNSGAVGALAGQTVDLKNSIAVTFGTSITGFGDTVWLIDGYRRSF